MTKILGFLLIAMSVTSVVSYADPLPSHRVFSTDPTSAAIPNIYEFRANRIEVAEPGWFNSLFDEDACQSAMSTEMNGRFEVNLTGPHSLEFSWNGRKFSLMTKAYASYIPTYFRFGTPIPAHVLIQLPNNFGFLHMTISTNKFGIRQLQLSLVKSDRNNRVKTILTAHEL